MTVEYLDLADCISLRLFVDINDWTWAPKPDIDDAESAVLAVASGEWDEHATANWLRRFLRPVAAD